MIETTMEHKENLWHAANYYGMEQQLRKTRKELSELYSAIHRRQFDGEGGIYEEMADVLNMIFQLCYLTGKEEAVRKIAEEKMLRTVKKIGVDW